MTSSIKCIVALTLLTVAGCAPDGEDTGLAEGRDTGGDGSVAAEKSISSSQADTLIAAGRAQLGSTTATNRCNCKEWAREIVNSLDTRSTDYSLPSTDTSPTSDQYKWTSTGTAAGTVSQVAQWVGSYANARYTPGSLTNGSYAETTFTESYGDPQIVILYAPSAGVSARISKGSTSATATSTSSSKKGGTASSATSSTSTGTWTLRVTNSSGGTISSGITAVVLSYSRFQSDWQTAGRGDLMQMYGQWSGSDPCGTTAGPHTTIVQTASNSGTNWLNANWSSCQITENAISMTTMMKYMACSQYNGFTVYRLN